jgi:CHAT domain-containing protein
MSRTIVRGAIFFWVAVLCVELNSHAVSQSETLDRARRLVAVVNENLATTQERQTAARSLSEAADLFLSIGEKVEAARTLNQLGHVQLQLKATEDAIATYERARRLAEESTSIEQQVDSLNGLGEVYLLLKKKEKVDEVIQQSLSLSQSAGYQRGQANGLLTLSDMQNYENHALALITAKKALPIWQALGDKPGLARIYSHIGRCYMAQNILVDATQNYEIALGLWRELNSKPGQADVLIMMGFIEYRKGDWQKSISYLAQAKTLVEENRDPQQMGQISAGLAEAFYESGLPEIGLRHYQTALDYYQQTHDPHLIMIGQLGVGVTNALLGKHDEARAYFEEVIHSAKPGSLEAASGYRQLGRIETTTGDYERALEHFEQALSIYTRAENPKEAAQVQALIGQVYERKGQAQKATEYYRQALATFISLSDRINQGAVLYALGRLELSRNNLNDAEIFLQQSIAVTEDIRRISTSRDLVTFFSATVHDRYEDYVDCLMRKHAANPSERLDIVAFETSELARGRSLADLLRATQTSLVPGLDSDLSQREKVLRQSLKAKEDYKVTLLGKQASQEELTALDMELAKLETQYKELTAIISARYPSYVEINRPTGWKLHQIQEQVLDDQTVLVEYSLGNKQSYVWTVTRSSITSRPLPSAAEINEAVFDVYSLLKTAPDEKAAASWDGAVEKLSAMVLRPVVAELNKPRVIIIADGALNYIPFQLLKPDQSSQEPLVASVEVINAPSASILGQLETETRRRQAPTKLLAAFGDPVFASNFSEYARSSSADVASLKNSFGSTWHHALRDFEDTEGIVDPAKIQPLIFTKIELAKLREVAGPDSLIATGFDATPEKISQADLGNYSILHIATHGRLDPNQPENSGLFLSMVDRNGHPTDGFLGLQDIYALQAPVDLVVLSACATGLGRDVRGEGLIGLTRGFMYAGASSVVASLWKVDDEATAELMKHFYINMLQRRMTPSAALRAAQNTIRQQPQWKAPYFWAAFTLQGDYQHNVKLPDTHSRFRIYAAITLLGLLAMSVLWFLYRRRRKAVDLG